jgi:hypothetical protein
MKHFFASGRRRRLILHVTAILLTAALVAISTLEETPPAEAVSVEAAVE